MVLSFNPVSCLPSRIGTALRRQDDDESSMCVQQDVFTHEARVPLTAVVIPTAPSKHLPPAVPLRPALIDLLVVGSLREFVMTPHSKSSELASLLSYTHMSGMAEIIPRQVVFGAQCLYSAARQR